jgi:hypothetical protein
MENDDLIQFCATQGFVLFNKKLFSQEIFEYELSKLNTRPRI